MTQAELDELMGLIAGRGRWAWTGRGLHTYPGTALHEACVDLERRGNIYRHVDEPDHVCWMDIETPPPR